MNPLELISSLKQELIALPEHEVRAEVPLDRLKRRVDMVLRRLCGDDSKHVKDFREIYFFCPVGPSDPGDDEKYYVRGKAELSNLLDIVEEEYRLFPSVASDDLPEAIARVEHLFSRIHLVIRQLRRRHDCRVTLDVKDEHDLQDLLGALLRVHFDDVRAEESTPSYAGKSSRIDFLIREEAIGIETKMTRPGLSDREVGSELIEDTTRYSCHPNCKVLLCLVYDPDGRIQNPVGLSSALSIPHGALFVRVSVVPSGG